MLAKCDEGNLVNEKRNIDLSDVVANSIRDFTPMLCGRSFAANISDGITVYADEMQIREVINILLDNAVRYSSEKSDIFINLYAKQSYGILSIENTADELPNVVPETLFERFYRSDASRNSKSGGCGIGLSIAKGFCEANNAKIKAEFDQNNKVIFTVTFKTK